MVEEGLELGIGRSEVELFLVVVADDHNFEELRVDVVGEGLYLTFFFEIDDFGSLKSERLVFEVMQVVLEVVDVALVDEDDLAVLHVLELLSSPPLT